MVSHRQGDLTRTAPKLHREAAGKARVGLRRVELGLSNHFVPWCSCYSRDSVGCWLRNGASDAVLSTAKKCALLGLLYQMGKLLFLMLCNL